MAKYRHGLPQLGGTLFLTDGGIETYLMFQRGLDLPHLAAFTLLRSEAGRRELRAYFEHFIAVAADSGSGFVLESPTWRASPDWAERLGDTAAGLTAADRAAIGMMLALREAHETPARPIPISGCIGPRHDAYDPERFMSAEEAQDYHALQIETFAGTEADLVSAITMTHAGEAIGIAPGAATTGMPVVISFTVESDGRLPSGQTLADAIRAVDDATGGAPAYFMVNCAHPSHFRHLFADRPAWAERLRGVRANASKCSHAELDASPTLDDGDPAEFGRDYAELRRTLPQLAVLGGCCGTDHRHVAEIARACAAPVA